MWPDYLEGEVTGPNDWKYLSQYYTTKFVWLALHRQIPTSNSLKTFLNEDFGLIKSDSSQIPNAQRPFLISQFTALPVHVLF